MASAFEANRQKAKARKMNDHLHDNYTVWYYALQNTLLEADHAQFACANPEKSEKTKVSFADTNSWSVHMATLYQDLMTGFAINNLL